MPSQRSLMKKCELMALLIQRTLDISNHWPATSNIIFGVFASGESIRLAIFNPLKVVL
jgi:hypothetical protein